MKKMKKYLSCLLAAVLMLTALIGTQAFAWTYFELEFTAVQGEKFKTECQTPNGQAIDVLELSSGSLPDGLNVTKGSAGNTVVISGTPTESGYFYADITVRTNDDDFMLSIMAEVTSAPSKITGTVNASLGKQLAETEVLDVGEMIQESYLYSGSLPAGMTCTQYDTYFTLSGTPTESGSFSATYFCYTEGGSCYATVKVNVNGSAELKVTKSPTSESVDVGDKATFISAAENYSDVEWRVVTKDGSSCWRNKAEIEAKFTGVKVNAFKDDDDEREYLVLSNIPASMNGYYIQTKFWSEDKSTTAFTAETSCLLSVRAELKVPTITAQPVSASKTVGEEITLSVAATDPNNGSLRYQWYSNTQPTTVGGKQISGAIAANYTPPQTEGTLYYYVSIASSKDGRVSNTVISAPAAVTYGRPAASPTPTPAPSATPGIDPETTPAVPTPVPTPVPASKNEGRLGSLIFYSVLVIALLAVMVVLIMMAKRGEGAGINIRMPVSPFWTCPNCGKRNKGHFCSECGTGKPEDGDI